MKSLRCLESGLERPLWSQSVTAHAGPTASTWQQQSRGRSLNASWRGRQCFTGSKTQTWCILIKQVKVISVRRSTLSAPNGGESGAILLTSGKIQRPMIQFTAHNNVCKLSMTYQISLFHPHLHIIIGRSQFMTSLTQSTTSKQYYCWPNYS